MATTEDTAVSLSKLFRQGQDVQHKIENSQMNSNSAEYQVNVMYSNILVQNYRRRSYRAVKFTGVCSSGGGATGRSY